MNARLETLNSIGTLTVYDTCIYYATNQMQVSLEYFENNCCFISICDFARGVRLPIVTPNDMSIAFDMFYAIAIAL